MLREYEEEFNRLVCPLGDYEELLKRGSVSRRVEDVDAWRVTMRAKARQDRLKVRTGVADHDAQVVWALLPNWTLTEEEDRVSVPLLGLQDRASDAASALGHDIGRWLAREADRAAAACRRCGARLYVELGGGYEDLVEGEAVEERCAIAGPPDPWGRTRVS
jgi:hypothetical protein